MLPDLNAYVRAGSLGGADLRAHVPGLLAAGDHHPHQVVQDRGGHAGGEGQLRRRMIDSAHGSTKWSKIAEAMQEEKASFFFLMKGFYLMSNENRPRPLPETVYGHRYYKTET
jgi:hypothetical protein